jgi:hypothetical protein
MDARTLSLLTSGNATNDADFTLVLSAIAVAQTAVADALKRVQTQRPPGPSNNPQQLAALSTIATQSQNATTIANAYISGSGSPPVTTGT